MLQISVFAVGRMKKGPECALAEHYFQRFAKAAVSQGLGFTGVREIAESREPLPERRKQAEGAALLAELGKDTCLVVLDERGKSISSRNFANTIAAWRDAGTSGAIIALGGPDGHSEEIRQRADLLLSFGAMTWPHQLARIMAAEQLYRATTIMSGHPYHRD